jgi:hypothetical protein
MVTKPLPIALTNQPAERATLALAGARPDFSRYFGINSLNKNARSEADLDPDSDLDLEPDQVAVRRSTAAERSFIW